MDAKSFGPIIREWRIESRLTQEALGERAGLSKKAVGSIERGERAPERQEIVDLCRALDRSPGELMTLWSNAFLSELKLIEEGSKPGSPPEEWRTPPESKVDQIIDKIAVLVKQLYRESKDDFRKMFVDWLAQSGASGSFPPPSPPRRPRKRVSRKRKLD